MKRRGGCFSMTHLVKCLQIKIAFFWVTNYIDPKDYFRVQKISAELYTLVLNTRSAITIIYRICIYKILLCVFTDSHHTIYFRNTNFIIFNLEF